MQRWMMGNLCTDAVQCHGSSWSRDQKIRYTDKLGRLGPKDGQATREVMSFPHLNDRKEINRRRK